MLATDPEQACQQVDQQAAAEPINYFTNQQDLDMAQE